jgi:electron transfer flavoprotein beta subunit
MKICVCVKHVLDTADTIKVTEEKGFEDTDIKFIPNPYDEFGMEEAVSIVEKQNGEVMILTVDKKEATSTIRSADFRS